MFCGMFLRRLCKLYTDMQICPEILLWYGMRVCLFPLRAVRADSEIRGNFL